MQSNISEQQAIDSLWFSQDCLGAMALFRAGRKEALPRAIADANKLLGLRVRDRSERSGWSYVKFQTPASEKCNALGSIDAFGDGTCNPPDTPYMIQTGYAVACLAQVFQATLNANFVHVAAEAIEDSWALGYENVTCSGSFEYLYSYDQNDQGRFVRNTNAIMGVGLVWLYEATGTEKYRQRALAIAQAEHCETQSANWGYFGRADPRYRKAPLLEARRIENHIPHQVKFLQLVAAKLKQPVAAIDAKKLLDAFLTCTEPQCRPNNCAVWAASPECRASQSIAVCMDQSDIQRREGCTQALAKFPRLSGFQLYLMEPF